MTDNIVKQIWAQVAPYVQEHERSHPISAQLQMGELAYVRMRTSVYDNRLVDFSTPAQRPQDHFLGVPIITGDLPGWPIDPHGWRLIDHHDNVIKEGVYEW